MRLWQEQERAERLRNLTEPLTAIACCLLLAHRDWDVQEQMHLDHATLEVRARPEEQTVLIACRWAEDIRWQGKGALEIQVTREFSAPHEFSVMPSADFCVVVVLEVRESFAGQFCEFSPVLTEALMAQILCAVEYCVQLYDGLTQTRR